jgi:hypothetical protein
MSQANPNHRWKLRLILELTEKRKVEITLGYRIYADLIINLQIASRLIQSDSQEPIKLEGGKLIYAEGINGSTGAITKRIDR